MKEFANSARRRQGRDFAFVAEFRGDARELLLATVGRCYNDLINGYKWLIEEGIVQELWEKIEVEGENLGNGILKIDSFLNHQVDAALMEKVGRVIESAFRVSNPSLILTAEVSGIIPAVMVALALDNIPVVYARKHKPITMREPVFVETAPSHTKGNEVNLMVSPEFLNKQQRVLIVDDFLASGKTIEALAQIVQNAGATLVGIATVVEKSFEGGRSLLSHWGVPILAVATVTDMSDGRIVVRKEQYGT